MYLAELHGKLSSKIQRMEDLLTSNVFSFFKYSTREIFLKEYLSLSSTFIAKFLTLKDTEDSQSPPASLTQTALQDEPLLLANQFRLD